jgi:putative salt-induced outer membrane protein YdiY
MRRTVATVATILAVSTVAVAQDPPPKPLKATGDISFVKTGGNTDVLSLGVSDKIEWKTSPKFTLKQNFGWVYGETDDVESANALLAGIRGEYALTSRVVVFAGFNYDYNLFAGVKRRFEEFAGLGFVVIDKPKDILRFDAGISYFQEWERYVDVSNNFMAGRFAADYKHLFAEKAYFQQIVEFLPNFEVSDDYRLNSETALVAPLGGNIAIKVGYVVRYRGQPPEGFEKTDTVFRTGIQITN